VIVEENLISSANQNGGGGDAKHQLREDLRRKRSGPKKCHCSGKTACLTNSGPEEQRQRREAEPMKNSSRGRLNAYFTKLAVRF